MPKPNIISPLDQEQLLEWARELQADIDPQAWQGPGYLDVATTKGLILQALIKAFLLGRLVFEERLGKIST